MKTKFAASCIVIATMLLPMAGYTADSDHSSATEMVNDSVITTKIKAELAAKKMSSLVHISVETDKKGLVTLGGTATSKAAADQAEAIAKSVKGVTAVKNDIKVVGEK